MTDELEVSCLNIHRGCKWTGERWSIKNHLQNDCEFTRILCICGELCERKVLIDNGMINKLDSGSFVIISKQCQIDKKLNKVIIHNDSDAYGGTFSDSEDIERENINNLLCPHSLIECIECGNEIKIMDINYHLEHECLKNMIICNGCHLSFPFMHLNNHQNNCQLLYVDCPGNKFGCTWKGQREILNKIHKPECVFIKMSGYLDQMESRMNSLNKENEGLRLQISSILNSVVNGKVSNLGYPLEIEEVGTLHKEIQYPSYENNSNNTKDEVDELIQNHSTQKISMSKVRTLVRELEMNKNVTSRLLGDNVEMREQLTSQRALLLNLKQQIQFMLIERRRMAFANNSTNGNTKNVATKL
ncbi:hypothetical protein C6P40_005336 [Pichia californica]|uniref:TRAF-type domain-containing protein n=1 Tax=Pichia californica TaxID=460514 RepID=A0A9P6WLF1_9ASCO|nr:hypothetical protein C6P42_000133 [[Candida] californica]KAG0689280.1 hypothetical protein C6P40_005336 [[Candida] californica]